MPEGRLPDFLVVGAPRAGTTSLSRYLRDHPQVFIAPQKEVHFFDDNYPKGLDWYRHQFALAGDALRVGEATPRYMSDVLALDRIAADLPGVRLVAILRHPVERAYSHYWLYRTYQPAHRSTFEDMIATDLAGTEVDRAAKLLGHGLYMRNIDNVLARFPREDFKVILLDDLEADPRGVFAGLCDFIGVDPAMAPDTVGEVHHAAFTYRFEKLRLGILAMTVVQRLIPIAWTLDRLNRKPRVTPPMAPATRARLLEYYREDTTRLADWLGRDLSRWMR